ncbi:PebIII family protein [Megaselia abdita]
MKFLVVGLLVLAVSFVSADEKYTTKYDGIDLDEVLKSDRLFNNYYKCLMETGKCTPDGRELKKNLPDALQTDCSKCSEKQKAGSEQVLRFIIKNKPKEWEELQAKFDPDHIFLKKYEAEGKAKGILA